MNIVAPAVAIISGVQGLMHAGHQMNEELERFQPLAGWGVVVAQCDRHLDDLGNGALAGWPKLQR